MSDLPSALGDLIARVAELERRVENTVRHGRVSAVRKDPDDEAHYQVRLRIGRENEEEPFESPWLRFTQVSFGPQGLNWHVVPKVGSQMTLIAQAGDFRQAVVLPYTWWHDHQSPSQNADESVIKWGDSVVTIKKDLLKLAVGSAEIEIQDGVITLQVGECKIKIDGTEIVTYGKTRLDDGEPNVVTVAGPAARVHAKV